MIHDFTRIIRSRGWTVREACEHWGIKYETYNKRCNNERMKAQLFCMCRGLERKDTGGEKHGD